MKLLNFNHQTGCIYHSDAFYKQIVEHYQVKICILYLWWKDDQCRQLPLKLTLYLPYRGSWTVFLLFFSLTLLHLAYCGELLLNSQPAFRLLQMIPSSYALPAYEHFLIYLLNQQPTLYVLTKATLLFFHDNFMRQNGLSQRIWKKSLHFFIHIEKNDCSNKSNSAFQSAKSHQLASKRWVFFFYKIIRLEVMDFVHTGWKIVRKKP